MIWCDLETFGLEDNSPILEYAFVITDLFFQVIDDHTDTVWTSPEYDELYRDMANPGVQSGGKAYVFKMHTDSGLWQEARSYGAHPFQAQLDISDWLEGHGVRGGEEPLCGNSVHQDRVWLRHTWPDVNARFHYRIVDVSSFKEVANRFDPESRRDKPEKGLAHRALADLHETIAEMRHYFKSGFIRDGIHKEIDL
jgi:oligoribonuclease